MQRAHDGVMLGASMPPMASGCGRQRPRLRLTGGAGVGDGIVVAGASHGDIIAVDSASGAQKWKRASTARLWLHLRSAAVWWSSVCPMAAWSR